jgi:hypothetical protein
MAKRIISVDQLEAFKKHVHADTNEGRKWQLLQLLIDHDGLMTMDDAVKEMTAIAGSDVDNKNVSSLLHYLRKDEGYAIPDAKGGVIRLIHGPIKEGSNEVEIYCSEEQYEEFLENQETTAE